MGEEESSPIEDTYRNTCGHEIARISKYLKSLSDDDVALLDFEIDAYVDILNAGVDANRKFLRQFNTDCSSSRILPFFKRWVREWSNDEERLKCYDLILNALTKHVPRDQKVWVPKASLGRLVYEIQKRQYTTIGTENHPLCQAAYKILSKMEKNEISFQPYVLETRNVLETGDKERVIQLPDETPSAHGELAISTEKPKETVGAVVSCFHLNHTEPLKAIRDVASVLAPGGIWIHYGSISAANDEEKYESSVMKLAMDEVITICSQFFTFPEETTLHPDYYLSNSRSMMKTRYNCCFFRAVRNDAPIPEPTPTS